MTDRERLRFLREPLEHATQCRAQDGGVLPHELGIGLAQGGQVPAARVLVGRAPAILDAGTQPRFDHRSARHGFAQRARKAGQGLCRPLRAARHSST
jgi:hypothetical protein